MEVALDTGSHGAGAGRHQRSSQQGAREAREEGDRMSEGQNEILKLILPCK